MGIRCKSEAVPATVSCSLRGILSIHATVRLIGWEGDKKASQETYLVLNYNSKLSGEGLRWTILSSFQVQWAFSIQSYNALG